MNEIQLDFLASTFMKQLPISMSIRLSRNRIYQLHILTLRSIAQTRHLNSQSRKFLRHPLVANVDMLQRCKNIGFYEWSLEALFFVQRKQFLCCLYLCCSFGRKILELRLKV